MRILLIHPPSLDSFMDKVFMFEPLALEYLAAGMVEEGLEVKILDSRIEPDIMGCVQRYNPDFVGVTSYTAQLNIAKKVCGDIKAFKPSVKIIFGGHHATVKPDDLNEPYIDAVVIGEGGIHPQGADPCVYFRW